MIVKETARSVYLDVSTIAWEPTPHPGVERKTVLLRMAPGAQLPDHRHVGVEQSFVLEGALADEEGTCTAGNFVWRRPGSVHRAWSPDGCLLLAIFEAPNEFLA